jgi:hypothetical protein
MGVPVVVGLAGDPNRPGAMSGIGGEPRGGPGDEGGESDNQRQRPDGCCGVTQEREQAAQHGSAPRRVERFGE